MAAPVRVSFAAHSGPRPGQPVGAPSLVAREGAAVFAEAVKRLRLKKKEAAAARLFLWCRDERAGTELRREGCLEALLRSGDLIAVSLGEEYRGPASSAGSCQAEGAILAAAGREAGAAREAQPAPEAPPPVSGSDDCGRHFGSLHQLWSDQALHYERYYEANAAWWDDNGYGGGSDEEAMIGDGGSEADVEHSLRFLDDLRSRLPRLQMRTAIDAGAGVGRVTKHVLLRRCEQVLLVEACERWLKQARRYLGNKRSQRCRFACARLQEYEPVDRAVDLVWVQWTLQYLVDAHVVAVLAALRAALGPNGVVVVKENRPCVSTGSGAVSEDAFRVDMPGGPHGRYDVTRPDAHHLWLFRCAGLSVEHSEQCLGGEVTTWALTPMREGSECLPTSGSLVRPSLQGRF
ncbi:unnamed protein product [Prorocentrum cordatum]|uniref:Alpha N-terminal protein methyltransferase 1 n=1 Tax=Prorocentrum cordatum TaxID=2364126 RepID=A0ABN9PXI5_9DINO|nr:unnamed protein product [Polarella glacialis]